MAKGTYVKPRPIGDGVVTTDDFIAKGYDFVPLYMGGMLKVDPTAFYSDATLATLEEKVVKPTDKAPAKP